MSGSAAGSTSAAYWLTRKIVYAVDYTRGIDILRYNGPGTDGGYGVQVYDIYGVASLTATRLVVEDTEGDGISVGNPSYPFTADLSDVVARNNGTWRGYPTYSGGLTGGSGISVWGDTTATISR